MNTEHIIQHLSTNALVKDRSVGELKADIARSLLNVYALSGLSKSMEANAMTEEVDMIATQLSKDILNNPSLRCLRVTEITYCFMAGVRGEFDNLKTYGINYQTFYKWLKAYAVSEERAEAMKTHLRDKERLMIAQKSTMTDDEKRRIMETSINSAYSDYLRGEKGKSTLSGILAPKGKILDLGNAKSNYLTKTGKKAHETSLEDFFKECKEKKLTTIF
ncbi:MAG: hypothetical protein M0R37_12980 [Bacteroidales bacterium]|nr:hypothetical protein [Bacteroidales bacterium]